MLPFCLSLLFSLLLSSVTGLKKGEGRRAHKVEKKLQMQLQAIFSKEFIYLELSKAIFHSTVINPLSPPERTEGLKDNIEKGQIP